MKTVRIAIAAVALLFAAGAQAQELRKTEARREMSAKMKQERENFNEMLKLTPEQQAKMKDIRMKYAGKTRELRNTEKAERRKKTLELHDQREAEIKAVLTADQYKSYLEYREKRKSEKEELLDKKKG